MKRVWKAIYVPAELADEADILIEELVLQKLRETYPAVAEGVDCDNGWEEEEDLDDKDSEDTPGG